MARALIVSAGTSSNEYLALHVAECGYPRPTVVPSCGEARRLLAGGDFELVVINMPLPDEPGHELARFAARTTPAGALLLARAAGAEHVAELVEEDGVYVLSKPFSSGAFRQSVRLAAATAHRLESLRLENERLRDRLETQRLVFRAKCLLIQREGLTEEQAHRRLSRRAMDERKSLEEAAEEILFSPENC